MSGRLLCNFNSDWCFLKLTQKGGLSALAVEAFDFDDSAWEPVCLPHTWNAIDGADGRSGKDEGGEDYYRGLGAYRKHFFLSADQCTGKRLFLEFKGANTVAEVFINGSYVGRHEGGFSAFRFDITKYVRPDTENVAAVKVNNAPTAYIAPITDQGDFTKMGGVYRDVNLLIVSPVHIDLSDYGSSGVYITPKNISAGHADVDMLIKLANDSPVPRSVAISAGIRDGAGTLVAVESTEKIISGHAEASFSLPVSNPLLWNGRKNPHLYTAEITLSADGEILDHTALAFGIRTYYIDSEKGFFLNGEYLDLRGVNYHQDSYENGWAMSPGQRRRDYEMIRDMGCTSVRMAHYQHDSYEYDLCDRLGLTVWTEIGIVNKMSADETDNLQIAEGFEENACCQLIELIRQNYNHPSIIVWGISNELYQMSDEIWRVYLRLNALAAREDSTRLTTFADAQFWGQFLKLPGDVVGYNRYFGWYQDAGPSEKFGEWLDLYHSEKETRPICLSEYGGGGAISQHKDNILWPDEIDPWGKRHYENYQSELHEEIWRQLAGRRYLWAKYIWCMFDFASDGREEGDTRGLNDKGLATRERVPKDAYFYYQAVWSPQPVLHLTEKRFSVRPAPVPRVKAYANTEWAELFVNGISCGKHYRSQRSAEEAVIFVWENIPLAPETENEIMIKGKTADGIVLEDRTVWRAS